MVPVTRAPLSRDDVVAGGHFYSWDLLGGTAMILPVLPKPSQQSIRRNWLPGKLSQNLIAVAYVVDHKTVYINLGALDGDGIHPQAAGERLFLSDYSENRFETTMARLKCFGRHIALSRCSDNEDRTSLDQVWQLQIWDWKYSTTSGSILRGAVPNGSPAPVEFCFLGNNRLLVVTDNLNLYSIEDMSQTPELLACFLMPGPLLLRCLPMIDDIGYDSQLHMQAQTTMYTSDPTHRLICLTAPSARDNTQVFIISTRIFFDLNEMAAAMPIPWQHWGPSNTRILWHPFHFKIHVNGNQVLRTFPVGPRNSQFTLQLLDFSPLAVINRRGLGRVVKEPSMTYISSLTTSLPYVQVVFSNRKFDCSPLRDLWIDKDRIYMLSRSLTFIDRLGVIDIQSDLQSGVVSTS
ncbi:uncharacterized protein F5891DRAFT_1010994 [Suillus fuscotomentosus]|uniref:Uncharacterized protein n=1 Tax=Suillus fuscotomentosus TaxID=1912939 RepID=A0AAD4EFE9_9AGAM|nr:uncharacterized protein F5891DRAFT_1010994 [Suillus fuscotomentosus]KAG1905120.1 hypothetical protein F5891DRAFT_1010994 [Suillus fuscotomentosus]